jgi:hypothetical protein
MLFIMAKGGRAVGGTGMVMGGAIRGTFFMLGEGGADMLGVQRGLAKEDLVGGANGGERGSFLRSNLVFMVCCVRCDF